MAFFCLQINEPPFLHFGHSVGAGSKGFSPAEGKDTDLVCVFAATCVLWNGEPKIICSSKPLWKMPWKSSVLCWSWSLLCFRKLIRVLLQRIPWPHLCCTSGTVQNEDCWSSFLFLFGTYCTLDRNSVLKIQLLN